MSGASPLAFLARGYAVLMDATMPVVGDPETMNDTYVEQVSAAAEAAVAVLDAKGVVDRRRIVVGGNPRESGEYYYSDDHYQSFRRIRE